MIPAIFGLSGLALTPEEHAFFKDVAPLGYILFTRNLDSVAQTKDLIAQLKDLAPHKTPILVDQEGGRVQRIKFDHIPHYPTMEGFGQQWHTDPPAACGAVNDNYAHIAQDLIDLGFNVDCAPVLDVRQKDAHDVIGDRAFSEDPACVADLGKAACKGMLARGITPIIKHIPGHGRATVDSHKDLPIISTPKDELLKVDFHPFKSLSQSEMASKIWSMTAHVVYEDIDRECATSSPVVLQKVIREQIGFEGIILTDDLDMKALKGSYADKTTRCFAAGADLVLHCDGALGAMKAIAAACPDITPVTIDRLRNSGF